MTDDERCTRLTAKGQRCRSRLVARLLLVSSRGTRIPSCHVHLTPEEASAVEADRRAWQEAMNRPRPVRDPVCWSWEPMPEGGDWWEWHPFMCAICGSKDRLVIDHDHATALIRGRLCHNCNIREGFSHGDDVFGLYRERNPASMWGFREVYWNPFHGEAKPEPALDSQEVFDASVLVVGLVAAGLAPVEDAE